VRGGASLVSVFLVSGGSVVSGVELSR
jgi:hypothetical protein